MSNIFDLFKKIEKQETGGPVSHIIVGLGNPGADYKDTRHNAGFMAIDYIAERLGISINRLKFRAMTAEVIVFGTRVLLMKPETFMNLSGEAVGAAASFYKISPENITVLHDEVSFDVGKFRIRRKGSAGGHNGLKSIIAHLSSDAFPRIKIGVGQKPSPEYDLANWVLGRFSKQDAETLGNLLPAIYESCELIIQGKIDEAMNKFSK